MTLNYCTSEELNETLVVNSTDTETNVTTTNESKLFYLCPDDRSF